MATQTENGKAVLAQLRDRANAGKWSRGDTYRVAYMLIACIKAESNMRILANRNVGESMHVPYDGFGSDHASVGLFQQQSPMWGDAASCMWPASAADKFINAALEKGLTRVGPNALPWWLAVQRIQGSVYADGSNYKAQKWPTYWFLKAHWFNTTRTVH